MASRCNRFISKSSISSLKSVFNKPSNLPKSAPKSPLPTRSTASPVSRFFMSRYLHLHFCVFLVHFDKFCGVKHMYRAKGVVLNRSPSELGGVHSLLPLHNAVAAARMTSCLSTSSNCRALSQGTLCCTSPSL
ncbi:hypothetical protein OSB04_010865 [Centaurea solstitialis]|uniref:Uncharacterized protein n=1 Tax=Centaurea solstitialis TaxID=347529 RepID=A0AA38WPN9_9ASTR|nr:hypothetical protein OSB04_010865 [Centaurea solstitialis]